MILGLDTSTQRLAWAVGSDTEPLVYGYFNAPAGEPDERRIALTRRAESLFESLPDGSTVFCEEPLALQNGKTTRLLGLAAGAIWAAHLRCDLTWVWVDAASWKSKKDGIDLSTYQRQLGTKKHKEAVALWAATCGLFDIAEYQLLLRDCPDVFDAAAIWQYGVRALDEVRAR